MRASQYMLPLAVALVFAVNYVSSVGVGGLAIKALMKTSERGVLMTSPPDQGLVKKPEFSKPLYKDYYSKTLVDVAHVVKPTLYQEQEYSVVLNETWDSAPVENQHLYNISTVVLQASPLMTPSASLSYDIFEWPTETQMYTTSPNMTTTAVVENGVPFL